MVYQMSILASATITDEEVPLSVFTGTWAVSNLVLAIMTVLECVMLLAFLAAASKEHKKIKNIPHRRREIYYNEFRRETTYTVLSIPIAIMAIGEYFITQDIQMRMVLFDSYTIIMALFFVAQTLLVIACRHKVLHIIE